MRYLQTAFVLVLLTSSDASAQKSVDSLLADTARVEMFRWCYSDGEEPPAEMRFWSNGLVEVSFRVKRTDKVTDYFLWNYANADSTEIRFVFPDPDFDYDALLLIERDHSYISSFDESARSVTYKTLTPRHDAMYFTGFRFDKEYCSF